MSDNPYANVGVSNLQKKPTSGLVSDLGEKMDSAYAEKQYNGDSDVIPDSVVNEDAGMDVSNYDWGDDYDDYGFDEEVQFNNNLDVGEHEDEDKQQNDDAQASEDAVLDYQESENQQEFNDNEGNRESPNKEIVEQHKDLSVEIEVEKDNELVDNDNSKEDVSEKTEDQEQVQNKNEQKQEDIDKTEVEQQFIQDLRLIDYVLAQRRNGVFKQNGVDNGGTKSVKLPLWLIERVSAKFFPSDGNKTETTIDIMVVVLFWLLGEYDDAEQLANLSDHQLGLLREFISKAGSRDVSLYLSKIGRLEDKLDKVYGQMLRWLQNLYMFQTLLYRQYISEDDKAADMAFVRGSDWNLLDFARCGQLVDATVEYESQLDNMRRCYKRKRDEKKKRGKV